MKIPIEKYNTELKPYQKKQLDVLNKWISAISPRTILDAGCGTGLLSSLINTDAHWTGLDISDAAESFHGEISHASMSKMPFDNRFFDMTICVDVLEHVEATEYELSINELARVTEKAIIIMFPNEYDLHILKIKCPFCGNWFHTDGHNRLVEPKDVIEIMEHYGFMHVATEYTGDYGAEDFDLRKTLFLKRFSEQLLYYKYNCTLCNCNINDFFIDMTDAQKSNILIEYIYERLKADWFTRIMKSSIVGSEIALTFIKTDFFETISSKIDDVVKNTCGVIEKKMIFELSQIDTRDIIHHVKSPYAFPMFSYIVTEGNELQLLSNRSYRFFLITEKFSTLDCHVMAETEGLLEVTYYDENNRRIELISEKHLEVSKITITFNSLPKLKIEGMYFEAMFRTKDSTKYHLILKPNFESDSDNSTSTFDLKTYDMLVYTFLLNLMIRSATSIGNLKSIETDLRHELKETHAQYERLLNEFAIWQDVVKETLAQNEQLSSELVVWQDVVKETLAQNEQLSSELVVWQDVVKETLAQNEQLSSELVVWREATKSAIFTLNNYTIKSILKGSLYVCVQRFYKWLSNYVPKNKFTVKIKNIIRSALVEKSK